MVIAVLAAGAVLVIMVWHSYNQARSDYLAYRDSEWPTEIQVKVLGRQLAGPESLFSVADEIKMGQGVITWKYKIDPKSKSIIEICAGTQIENCTFYRYSNPKDNVDQYVRYKNGLLIVQEAWR